VPDTTPMNPALKEFPSLADLKRRAGLVQARVLGRNGHAAEALKVITQAAPSTGYEKLLAAEALLIAGDKVNGLKFLNEAAGNIGGHPDGGWGSTFIPMRIAMLAFLSGENKLAVQYGQNVVNRGEAAEKYPQWKSGWALTKLFVDAATAGATPTTGKLKNGEFDGEARGFDDIIKLKVIIAGGKIKEVKIMSQKESRPWSVLEEVPERIVKAQSAQVDAVTGATVTSSAVIGAADQALRKAAQ
jgi:uncharacterized protein with FMN-binding domain